MHGLFFGVLALVALAQTPSSTGVDMAVVRDLYVQAAYEEALALLGRTDDSDATEQVEQYRALCLLALGRVPEAEQAIERLVKRRPTYEIPEAEVSPRLVALFREVRERALPMVARELYATAKDSFDRQQYLAASNQLRQLMTLLADEDLAAHLDSLADLKQLAQGFLQLTELELAAAAKAAAAPPPPPARAAPAVTTSRIVVYSADDADVVPPVEVFRRMPPWNPPSVIARNEYRGAIEVVLDERGAVESASIVRPSSSVYDVSLLDAAKLWRFEPALRAGKPVKYRLTFDIVLAPRQ